MIHTMLFIGCALAVICACLGYIYFHVARSRGIECPFCVERIILKENVDHKLFCRHCQVDFVVEKNGDLNPCIETPSQYSEPSLFQASWLPRLSAPTHGSIAKQPTNGLCRSCNHHQRIIVSLLSQIDHIDQDTNDGDGDDRQLADWKSYLERKYPLCSPCQLVVQKKLAGLGQTLKLNYLDLLLVNEKRKRVSSQGSVIAQWNKTRLFIFVFCFLVYMIPYYGQTRLLLSWTCLLGWIVSILDPISTLFTIILSAAGLYLRHLYGSNILFAMTMETGILWAILDVLFYTSIVNPYLMIALRSYSEKKGNDQEPFFKLQKYQQATERESEKENSLSFQSQAPSRWNHLNGLSEPALNPFQKSPFQHQQQQSEPFSSHRFLKPSLHSRNSYASLSSGTSSYSEPDRISISALSLSSSSSSSSSYVKLGPSILSPPTLGLEDSFASFKLSDENEPTRLTASSVSKSTLLVRSLLSLLLLVGLGSVAILFFYDTAFSMSNELGSSSYCRLF